MSAGPRLDVGLRPYAAGDLPLLERVLGDPAMTVHLGGPESPDAIRARHQRYLASDPAAGGLFAIVVGPRAAADPAAGSAAGWVGYWEASRQGEALWECGWNVLPEYQGRGVATAAATLLLHHARARGTHRIVQAFPAVGNAPSNALCRRLGFAFHGEVEVEYPAGKTMRSNDWRFDLMAARGGDEP